MPTLKTKITIYIIFTLFVVLACLPTSTALASTTDGAIDTIYKYSWSNNLGWLNFGTSSGNVHIIDTGLTGYVWSPNYGWINLSPQKAGVTNNGEGILAGYAWGENTGWINFNGVTINSSGKFTGTASGSISGDISFDCVDRCTIKTDWRPLSVRQPITPPQTPPSGGGGGGGGGGGNTVTTQVVFSGRAYPLSKVVILKDGQTAITTIAGLDATFNVSLSNLSAGNYNFDVYGEDSQGRRSNSFSFPVTITSGATANVSGIFLSPTIDVDKTEVKKGDTLTIFGQSAPTSDINIVINSETELFAKTKADKNGVYLYNLDTSPLEIGEHSTKSKSTLDGLITSYGLAANFKVGTKSVTKTSTKCSTKGDLNNDCKVNLVDFSIAAYWYKRSLSDIFKNIEKAQLNGDGKITLVDFSIMAYYWTG